jgi:hypothetical protein
VLGASAPPVSDSPPDAAAQRGAASHSLSSSDEGFGDGRGGSSSDDMEELTIVKIVGHRDTKGQPDDPVLDYYTVRFAELKEAGADAEMELPESELLRRCPKLLRAYGREVGRAAAAATSSSSDDDSSAEEQSPASGRSGGRAGARLRARAWTQEEVAQVKRLGRKQRGKQLGEAGFEELAQRLRRSRGSVYSKWMKIQSPKLSRVSCAGDAKQGRRSRKRRRKKMSEGAWEMDEVGEELRGSYGSSKTEQDLRNEIWQWKLKCAELNSQVFTLRECLHLLGMRGIGGERRGSYGGGGSYGGAGAGVEAMAARPLHDPLLSQHLPATHGGY